jgi:hypothetical protein
MTKTLLSGHVSPETAYLVADYPYGFRLRCQIRYWLEHDKRRGVRFVSQTTNPKAGAGRVVWKPKVSTYSRIAGAMYLDEAGHVQHAGLSEYCTGAEAAKWLETYGAGVPAERQEFLRKFVAAKLAYDATRAIAEPGASLVIGLPEARKAFTETK